MGFQMVNIFIDLGVTPKFHKVKVKPEITSKSYISKTDTR